MSTHPDHALSPVPDCDSVPGSVPAARPTAIHHVRLTVTDITRSKDFYARVLDLEPAFDFSDQAGDPDARRDPHRFFAGTTFTIGDQLLGLRPVAAPGDHFDATRVGLDHISLHVATLADLHTAAERLDALGIEHGAVTELDELGIAIVSLQDPDDINLELVTDLP